MMVASHVGLGASDVTMAVAQEDSAWLLVEPVVSRDNGEQKVLRGDGASVMTDRP